MKRTLVVLGVRAWREWILPFLADPRFATEIVHDAPTALRPGQFDAILFLSAHETLRRDLGMAAALAPMGARMICQPQAMVALGLNKRLMARRAAMVDGIEPIPEMSAEEAKRYLAGHPGRAVIAKPNDGTEGQEIRLFHDLASLAATGARLIEGGHLLQPFLAGQEYSVNMAWHEGRCNLYPPVGKGRVDARAKHPILRTRHCPADLVRDPRWDRLAQACVAYLEPFRPSGLVEMEFIQHGDRFSLLDVNPRLSATMRLNAVASRSNPLTDWIAAVCDVAELGERVQADGRALEWPLTQALDPAVRQQLCSRGDVWISTRVTVAAPDEATLVARVAETRKYGAR